MNDAKQRKKEEDDEAKKLSRSFARNLPKEIEIQPIGRAMALDEKLKQEHEEREILEEIETFYDPENVSSNPSIELRTAMREMVEAWKELKDTGHAEKGRTFNLFKKGIPSEQQAKPEMNSIKAGYQRMCQKLDNYSGLFKFVPSGDEYISTLIGTIETIVEATVNHTKIGQGFTDAIESIGRGLEYCSRSTGAARARNEVHRTRIRTMVIEVFTLCFKFLGPYARWCASRFERFKGSLNKNYYQDMVQGPLEELLGKIKEIERENVMQVNENQISMKGKVDEMSEDLKSLNKKMDDRDNQNHQVAMTAQIADCFTKFLEIQEKRIGAYANSQTELAARRHIQEEMNPQGRIKTGFDWRKAFQGIEMKEIPPLDSIKSRGLCNWDDVEAASHFLETVADKGYPIDMRDLQDFKISPSAFHALEDWMATQESRWLWMQGPPSYDGLSEVSTAAYYTFIVNDRLNMPLLCYRFRADEAGIAESVDSDIQERSVEMDRFVLMMYSMIRQMVWLLPKEVDTDIDLSAERFQRLDASTESLLDAFNLIKALLSFMPKILIVILDGFQFVDNDIGAYKESTNGYLELFLEILREAGSSRVLKVLITSDGHCRSLFEEDVIHLDEQVDIGWSGDEQERVAGLFDFLIEDLSDEEISIDGP